VPDSELKMIIQGRNCSAKKRTETNAFLGEARVGMVMGEKGRRIHMYIIAHKFYIRYEMMQIGISRKALNPGYFKISHLVWEVVLSSLCKRRMMRE
jgi:hypothetical protein